MTVERALRTLRDRYRAWSAVWGAEVEHNPKGVSLPAIRSARDSVQRRTSKVLARVGDRLARLTASERAASACHLREPSVAGRVDSHIRALDDMLGGAPWEEIRQLLGRGGGR